MINLWIIICLLMVVVAMVVAWVCYAETKQYTIEMVDKKAASIIALITGIVLMVLALMAIVLIIKTDADTPTKVYVVICGAVAMSIGGFLIFIYSKMNQAYVKWSNGENNQVVLKAIESCQTSCLVFAIITTVIICVYVIGTYLIIKASAALTSAANEQTEAMESLAVELKSTDESKKEETPSEEPAKETEA
jgi:peptidoglycan/LPS O-acetylase OafA/YrhL